MPGNRLALARNPSHSFRILSESFSQRFALFCCDARRNVGRSIRLCVRPGPRRTELIGQGKKVPAGEYYDVWRSYRVAGVARYRRRSAQPSTRSKPLSGPITHWREKPWFAFTWNERESGSLGFQFSRQINIDGSDSALGAGIHFSGPEVAARRAHRRNGDVLFVLLPNGPKPGEEFELTLRYHGNVITDAGNGVLFVGSRESWYPHLGDSAEFSTYDLTFHWPKKFRLAATGTKLDEHEEGERNGTLATEKPASVAGFNLGEYAFASLASKIIRSMCTPINNWNRRFWND